MTPRLSLVIVLGFAILALAPSVQAQQPGVRAESGGVAIGGSVSGSTINMTLAFAKLGAVAVAAARGLLLLRFEPEAITLPLADGRSRALD